jgi:hypothetical protein
VDPKPGPVEGGDDERIDHPAQGSTEPELRERQRRWLLDLRRVFCKRRQDVVDGRVIPRLPAHVSIGQVPVAPDHEHASELPGVSLDRALARSSAERPKRVPRQAWRESLDATAPEASRAIGPQLGVHEQRAVELVVLPEGGGEVRGSVSHDDEFRAAAANPVDPVAQLRDLLTAEQSAEVSDEDEDDRLVFPQGAQADGLPRPVAQFDSREPSREPRRPLRRSGPSWTSTDARRDGLRERLQLQPEILEVLLDTGRGGLHGLLALFPVRRADVSGFLAVLKRVQRAQDVLDIPPEAEIVDDLVQPKANRVCRE